MILEAVNSVFLTFLFTEYLLIDSNTSELHRNPQHDSPVHRLRATLFSRHSTFIQCSIGVVSCINLFVKFHVSGAAMSTWLHSKAERLFHIPRILLAIASFLISLYFDCRRMSTVKNSKKASSNSELWSNKLFLRELVKSFCILLPVYPFLAVVISFGFLFIVSIFEKMNWSLEILNMPIYYGTLYGPLSYLYWDVKRKMAATNGRVNGGVGVLGGTVLPR